MVYAIPFAGAQELVVLKVVNLNRLWPTRLQNVTFFTCFPIIAQPRSQSWAFVVRLDVELIHPPFGPSLTGIFHPSVRHTSCLALLAALAISTMASLKLIDGQFDRAVEIVQGLPKNGPIQTDYEEKLTMYRQVVFFAFEKVEGSCYPDLLQSLQTRCLKSTAWLQTLA